jgi:epoxide hydrolase-like predicted phosphatase
MIKAILFDIGGVILNMELFNKRIMGVFKVNDKDKFWEQLNLESLPLCRGDVTFSQFWKELQKNHHRHIAEPQLKRVLFDEYQDLVRLDKGVLNLAANLRKNYKVAIVSNSIPQHSEVIRGFGFLSNFDAVILSDEVHMTKDAKDIFLLAAKELKVKPEQCVFIDDIESFCKVASSTGMKAILFRNSSKLEADLQEIGVKLR